MTLDSQEILNYIKVQKRTFETLPLKNDFNDGLLEGLNLVKVWIEISIGRENNVLLP